MPVALADPSKSVAAAETGAPIAKDAIDPDLVKLARARPKIGLVTAAGLVFLCGLFLVRLAPDRRFAGSDATPAKVAVADVLSGTAALDRYVELDDIEPLYSHAIRIANEKGSLGVRAVPVRGTGDRLWLGAAGDGWAPPSGGTYRGRLRRLADLPFAASLEAYAAAHPRPVFATASAIRAGLSSGKVQTVTGETIALADADKLAFDVVDPDASTVVGALGERFPDARAWAMALVAAGVPADGSPEVSRNTVRYRVLAGASAVAPKLEAAKLWGARVEPVTAHYETTWGALRGGPPGGFATGSAVIPDSEIDLVGAYVAHGIPSDAIVLLAEERPGDYWYVLPITIALAAIGLVFAWALVRAVRRDLLPVKPATSTSTSST
jgi:hypothetical protein